MVKLFTQRIAKKNRETIDLFEGLPKDLFNRLKNNSFLKGAKIIHLALKNICVKEQVRTKFNDHSLEELAQNIKQNGLIQPLVVHLNKQQYTLICGERRYRAMSSLGMKAAPCFILENKTEKELMAIQFSENSSRESLHYIDKSEGIYNYKKATRASERKMTHILGISKSEIHRSLIIAKMPKRLKDAAKMYDIEKYVLLEFNTLEDGSQKKAIETRILEGRLTKRSTLKKAIREGGFFKRKVVGAKQSFWWPRKKFHEKDCASL